MDYSTFFTTIFYYILRENQAKNRKSLIRAGFQERGDYFVEQCHFCHFSPFYDTTFQKSR